MQSLYLTHPDRILYPKDGITKLEVAHFYEEIQQWILPHIINRPLTLLRCTKGIDENCFYQKHLTDTSNEHLFSLNIKEKNNNQPYIYIKDFDGLMALIQLNVLEIHPWGSTTKQLEKPDHIIFDLDPAPDVNWKEVIHATRFIRDQLLELNLMSFVKTTGGKGLHLVVPIKPQHDWEKVKIFSHTFVNSLVSQQPEKFTSALSKAKRKNKIFIDYLRNQRGATAIAPYSTRAKNHAPIATPLSWQELSVKIKSDTFTIKNLPKRLAKLTTDPWEGFFDLEQLLTKIE